MKICYSCADVFIPGTTGGSTHTLEVARALADLGHKVHLVCRRGSGQPGTEKLGKIIVHRIRRSPWPDHSTSVKGGSSQVNLAKVAYHAYLHTVFASYAALYLTRLARTYDVDVFIERGTSFGEATFASVITARALIVEVIGTHLPPLSLTRARWILTFTENLPSLARGKIRLVRAGVNTKLFHPGVDPWSTKAELGLGDQIVVGYSGSFVYWHDLRTLLEAVAILKKEGLNLKLLLVGRCPVSVRELVHDLKLDPYVMITGTVPYNSVPKYLASCDVLVAPYLPSLGAASYSYIKLFEYAAMGKPIISTKGIPDQQFLEPRGAAMFVDERNAPQLSETIRQIASNPSKAVAMGERARLAAEERSWKAYARDLDHLLRAL